MCLVTLQSFLPIPPLRVLWLIAVAMYARRSKRGLAPATAPAKRGKAAPVTAQLSMPEQLAQYQQLKAMFEPRLDDPALDEFAAAYKVDPVALAATPVPVRSAAEEARYQAAATAAAQPVGLSPEVANFIQRQTETNERLVQTLDKVASMAAAGGSSSSQAPALKNVAGAELAQLLQTALEKTHDAGE